METAGGLDHDGETIAWRRRDGAAPTVVWLGGFRSDMTGTKAQALDAWAELTGRAFLRFDYTGHGASSGAFVDGTIGRWRSDAIAAIDELSKGPLILVGSSMGAWISLLLARARPERIAGMVLIAPAPDFTDKLMEPSLPDEARAAIASEGVWTMRSDYDPAGYPLTRALLDDGRNWSVLPGPIKVGFPVRILQGTEDPDVPWRHAVRLQEALDGPDTALSLIPGGDHRLSRPEDIEAIVAAVEAV